MLNTPKMKILLVQVKIFWETEIEVFSECCFTWKLEFDSNILRMIVGRLTEKLSNNSTNNFMLTRILNRLNLIPISIYGKAKLQPKGL